MASLSQQQQAALEGDTADSEYEYYEFSSDYPRLEETPDSSSYDYYYNYYNDQTTYESTTSTTATTTIPSTTFQFAYERILQWMEYCSRPPVPMAMALLVILYFHFQDSIHAWWAFYFPPHVSWQESLTELFWQLLDLIRGMGQGFRERVRRYFFLMMGNKEQPDSSNTITTTTTTSGLNTLQSPRRTASATGRRTPMGLPDLVKDSSGHDDADDKKTNMRITEHKNLLLPDDINSQAENKRRAASKQSAKLSSSLPSAHDHNEHDESSSSRRPRHSQPLEPTFLNDQDYPQGWMVYHAELGVVSKERADEYEREQQQQYEQEQEMEPDKRITPENTAQSTTVSNDSSTTSSLDVENESSSSSTINPHTSSVSSSAAHLRTPVSTETSSTAAPASSQSQSSHARKNTNKDTNNSSANQPTNNSNQGSRSRRNRNNKKKKHANLRPAVLPSTIAAN